METYWNNFENMLKCIIAQFKVSSAAQKKIIYIEKVALMALQIKIFFDYV